MVSSNLRPAVDQGCRADDTADPDAVVVIVRVTGTVVVDDVKVTVEGLKLQVLYGGKFEHIEGERVPVPVKPFCVENVRVVDPDCPGVATVIVVGLAEMVYAPPTSIKAAGDVDPLKFESPLYWTVMLSSPSGIWFVLKLATGGLMLESIGIGAVNAVPLERKVTVPVG